MNDQTTLERQTTTLKETHGAKLEDQQNLLKVEWRRDGQLWAGVNGDAVPVQASLCFPWSKPSEYISLRNDDEDEVALIPTLDELDDSSRQAVEQALASAGFVLEVTQVIQTREDFDIRQWKVMTRQGVRTFQTKLDDWPHQTPGGGWLFSDIAKDLFFISDIGALDQKSQKELWAFVS